jgi:hypothetical protein
MYAHDHTRTVDEHSPTLDVRELSHVFARAELPGTSSFVAFLIGFHYFNNRNACINQFLLVRKAYALTIQISLTFFFPGCGPANKPHVVCKFRMMNRS